jgi:hypothetical protein
MEPKAILKGWNNYRKDTDIPQERLEAIYKCPHCIDAPIKALNVKDRYEETSGKICDKCYCPMPAKARQNIDICPCWKK